MSGKFGFYLGANTQVQIDYIYISALKEYNGANKLFNLSEEDAQKLIEEQESIKTTLQETGDPDTSTLAQNSPHAVILRADTIDHGISLG